MYLNKTKAPMKYFVYLLSIALFVASCSETKESALAKVEEAESNLYAKEGNFQFNDSLATITIDAYLNYADNFKQDSLAAEYLFKAADLYRAKREFQQALEVYDRLQKNHPDFRKIPQTVFLQGFVYENDLRELDNARERYEAFIAEYPNHDLVKDVQFSLKNLGKTPEQIIEEFTKKQQEEAAAAAADTVAL